MSYLNKFKFSQKYMVILDLKMRLLSEMKFFCINPEKLEFVETHFYSQYSDGFQ